MSTSSEALLNKASKVISAGLGLSEDSVTIGTGDKKEVGFGGNAEKDTTNIVLTINGLGSDLNQIDAQNKILAVLDKIPDVKKVLQTIPDESLAVKAFNQLKNLAEGTNFNTKLLEWKGFDQKLIKEKQSIRDYAIDAVANAYGITFHISIATDKNTDPKELTERTEENVKGRLPEIKALLADVTVKYITQNLQHEGKSEAEIATAVEKARTDMEKLNISLNLGRNGGIEVTIRSPEQTEAFKVSKDEWSSPENADSLKASNPLHELSEVVLERDRKINPDASSQLKKAVSRAFLFGGGEKAMEVFTTVAGRSDIANAITKEATNFPEKEAEFKEVLSSDFFKKHGWKTEHDDAGAAPSQPLFKKNHEKPDSLELWIMDVNKDKVKPIIESIAAMHVAASPVQNSPAHAPARPTTEQPDGVIEKVLAYFTGKSEARGAA